VRTLSLQFMFGPMVRPRLDDPKLPVWIDAAVLETTGVRHHGPHHKRAVRREHAPASGRILRRTSRAPSCSFSRPICTLNPALATRR
jgi:hypothetical protein